MPEDRTHDVGGVDQPGVSGSAEVHSAKAQRDAERARFANLKLVNPTRFEAHAAGVAIANLSPLEAQCPLRPLGVVRPCKFHSGTVAHILYKHPKGRRFKAVACDEHYRLERGERIKWIPEVLRFPERVLFNSRDQVLAYVASTEPHWKFYVMVKFDENGAPFIASAYPANFQDPEHAQLHGARFTNFKEIWHKEKGPVQDEPRNLRLPSLPG